MWSYATWFVVKWKTSVQISLWKHWWFRCFHVNALTSERHRHAPGHDQYISKYLYINITSSTFTVTWAGGATVIIIMLTYSTPFLIDVGSFFPFRMWPHTTTHRHRTCKVPVCSVCTVDLPDSRKRLTPDFSFLNSAFCSDVSGSSPAEPSAVAGDGGLQYAAWKAPPTAAGTGLQSAMTCWSSQEYAQTDPSAQTLSYPATPTLTADVYMQALCPSYTMLTYTHAPLLTNFGVSKSQRFANSTLQIKVKHGPFLWSSPLPEACRLRLYRPHLWKPASTVLMCKKTNFILVRRVHLHRAVCSVCFFHLIILAWVFTEALLFSQIF